MLIAGRQDGGRREKMRFLKHARKLNVSTKQQAQVQPDPVKLDLAKGDTQRIGSLAIKRGMAALFDTLGNRIPCTILEVRVFNSYP